MTEKCFWCKKEIIKSITLDKKEFCSTKCVKEYKEKTDDLLNSDKCEFC